MLPFFTFFFLFLLIPPTGGNNHLQLQKIEGQKNPGPQQEEKKFPVEALAKKGAAIEVKSLKNILIFMIRHFLGQFLFVIEGYHTAYHHSNTFWGDISAADVKMEIPAPVRPLRLSILSSTSFQLDYTFWRLMRAAADLTERQKRVSCVNAFSCYVSGIIHHPCNLIRFFLLLK